MKLQTSTPALADSGLMKNRVALSPQSLRVLSKRALKTIAGFQDRLEIHFSHTADEDFYQVVIYHSLHRHSKLEPLAFHRRRWGKPNRWAAISRQIVKELADGIPPAAEPSLEHKTPLTDAFASEVMARAVECEGCGTVVPRHRPQDIARVRGAMLCTCCAAAA